MKHKEDFMTNTIKMPKTQSLLCALVWVAFIAIATFVFFGCSKGSGRNFSDVTKVEDWLANQKGGASPDDPIPFSVKLNLQNMASPESNWQKLLTSINTAGLYVALDLSGSTMPGTVFDADGGIKIGKQFIVSLVLPDGTESVNGYLYGQFDNLKTAKAQKLEFILYGSTGPAGGFVFYDKGNSSDGWRFLEAAPSETEFRAEWGAYGKNVTGTEDGIGTGKRNTELIVSFLGNSENGRAAQRCVLLDINGFNDWFLPSRDELDLIYRNLHINNIGGFSNTWYWSSSQLNYDYAWGQFFGFGSQGDGSKYGEVSVRAIRAF